MKVAGTKWRMIGMDILLDIDGKKGFHSIEELSASVKEGEPDEWSRMAQSLLCFTEDGKMQSIVPIPEGTPQEELDRAISRGMTIVDEKFLVVDTKAYTQEKEDEVTYDGGISSDNPEDMKAFNTILFDEEGHLKIFAMFGYSVYEQV